MEVLTSSRTTVFRRSLGAFLLLCVLSWPVWLASGVLPRAGTGGYDARWLVAQIGVMVPSLAALFVSGLLSRELRRNSLRLLPLVLVPLLVPGILVAQASPARVFQMPLLPAAATVVVAAIVVLIFSPLNTRLLGPATGTPQAGPPVGVILLSLTLLPALFLLAWAVAGPEGGRYEIAALQSGPLRSAWILLVCFAHNLLLGGSLGEEIGWRGFLLPALLTTMPPLRASVVLGVVWGLWHLPIDLYAGFGVSGLGAVGARAAFAIAMSVLFTWFYLRSKGNLLVAMLLHTSGNVMSDLGFSSYGTTTMVLGLLTGAASVLLSAFSPVFRRAEADR